MLELHIDVCASYIVVEEIENSIVFFVYMDIIFVLIQRQILDDHRALPRYLQILAVGDGKGGIQCVGQIGGDAEPAVRKNSVGYVVGEQIVEPLRCAGLAEGGAKIVVARPVVRDTPQVKLYIVQ